MLHVTRLNGTTIVINADLIESIEATPDTVIALVTQRKIVVKESPDTLVERAISYHQRCAGGPIRRAPLVALREGHLIPPDMRPRHGGNEEEGE